MSLLLSLSKFAKNQSFLERRFYVLQIRGHNNYFLTIWLRNYTFLNSTIGDSIGHILLLEKPGRKLKKIKTNKYGVPKFLQINK